MQNWTTFYAIVSILISFTAATCYLNARYWKLPTSIATMASSLVLSLIILIAGQWATDEFKQALDLFVSHLNFEHLLMQGMLSFLLFAGALHVNLSHLHRNKGEIFTLAFVSTLLSTFFIGAIFYYLLPLFGFSMPFIYCLLFGALISPTDPIAVLAIFKKVKASPTMNVTVTGESLFNDGLGIVIFLTLYQLVFLDAQPTVSTVFLLFVQEAIGGLAYGLFIGYLGKWLISTIDDMKTQILITLAIASGGYVLANALHLSGPLAMVAAGLVMGNSEGKFIIPRKVRHHLREYWEGIDEVLNAVLFFLIGLQLIIISYTMNMVWVSLVAIPIVLLVRFITVAIPIHLFKFKRPYPSHFVRILTWGGLRGGLAVALALSLPNNPYSNLILAMTYGIVIFSILVQGLTAKPLVIRGKHHASTKRNKSKSTL